MWVRPERITKKRRTREPARRRRATGARRRDAGRGKVRRAVVGRKREGVGGTWCHVERGSFLVKVNAILIESQFQAAQ